MSSPELVGQWGVLGGAFDPVHNGHLTLATDIRCQCDLEGVVLVPAAAHPFKNNTHASFEDRMNMLRAAVAGDEGFLVSDVEQAEDLPGHTLDTVRALKKKYPRAELYFIMGEDNLDDFHRWHRPDELMREVKILVGYRPPHVPDRESVLPSDRSRLVPTRLVDISATEIREMISHNPGDERLPEMVPARVLKYIREHGLYQ